MRDLGGEEEGVKEKGGGVDLKIEVSGLIVVYLRQREKTQEK